MLSLDHYVGRPVEKVVELDPEDGEGTWEIVLEGGIRIINFDEEYEMPDAGVLVGSNLNSVVLSAQETRLHFGTSDNPQATQMFLNPTEYGIADPNRDDIEGIVRPQTSDVRGIEEARPEEPAERLAEGPVKPSEEDAEEAAAGSNGAEGGAEGGRDG